jgi:antitoxin (DNA-binding transcriptional repressor) of toxin-antitoxin stability system
MFHMKTASVRELRQSFPRILVWLQAGEEVAITLRRRAVARLVPYRRKPKGKQPMPDIAARLERVFGGKTLPDKAIQSVLDHDRGHL